MKLCDCDCTDDLEGLGDEVHDDRVDGDGDLLRAVNDFMELFLFHPPSCLY